MANKKRGELDIVLVRHGQASAENIELVVQDPPLTRLGRTQARRVGKRLAAERFDRIYASDLARARQTADAIRAHHPRTPFTIDPDAREVNGHHNQDRRPAKNAAMKRALKQERACAERFCRTLIERHRPGQRICVVVHGNFIRLFTSLMAGIDTRKALCIDINNTSVTVMKYRKDWSPFRSSPARLTLANCVRHLLPHQQS